MNYQDNSPVWTNHHYFEAVEVSRELYKQDPNNDLYSIELFRKHTRDQDTGEQFAYKCNELIEYGQPSKVLAWKLAVLLKLQINKNDAEDLCAYKLYDAVLDWHNHKWSSDSYSRSVWGVHTAYLDLARNYKLDIPAKRLINLRNSGFDV